MTTVLLGPDEDEVQRWSSLGRPIAYLRQFSDVSDEQWSTVDAVLLDLQLFRVGTSNPDLDLPAAIETIEAAGSKNPDAFWLLIAPPVLTFNDAAHRLARTLGQVLRGHEAATQVATEPHDIAQVIAQLRDWLDEVQRVDAIPVAVEGTRVLAAAELRCLHRLLRDCDSAECEAFGDGQSDAVVLRVKPVMNGGDGPTRVIKLGPASQILREHNAYFTLVHNRIGLARSPHHDHEDVWMAGASAGISYSFSGGSEPKTLARVMFDGDGCTALAALWAEVLKPWLEMRKPSTEPIASYIEGFLGMRLDDAQAFWDAAPEPLNGVESPFLWLRSVAGRINDVPLARSIAHGDLHAYNVLVDEHNQPWLIDFYHTDWNRALFDSAYSDVYLLLHRVGANPAPVDRPNEEILAGESAYYEGGDPVRPELQVVRTAALNAWGGSNAALFHLARACVAIRLLQFPSTDHALAKAVAGLAAAAARGLAPHWEVAPEVEPIEF